MSGWHWRRIREDAHDDRVVAQLHEFGCGAAAAAMLLADRGMQVDVLAISGRLRLPCSAQELAACLNGFEASGNLWMGGQLDLDPPLERAHIAALGARSSWAAQLIPTGARSGHWVVVDDWRPDGLVDVRDPAGSSYAMLESEFVDLMRFMVIVLQLGDLP